ncbi:poly [ADP-ribose] polymerase 2/3/4 [Sarotherodon galilaeus]
MKLPFSLILLWALSTTDPASQSNNGGVCNFCNPSTGQCTSTLQCQGVENQCFQSTSESLSTSSGTTTTQIYKACASSSLCPAVTSQTFSVNLGFQSALASAQCCDTDNCNSATLPNPASQSNNGGVCNFCDPSTGQCTSTLQCQGVENQCFQSTMPSGISTSVPVKGCMSENICTAVSSLLSLPVLSLGNVSCCDNNLCNTALTTTTFIYLLFGLIYIIY